MTLCMICGEKKIATEDHDTSEKHQLAGAAWSIDIADSMRLCPWCPGKKGLKNLKACTVSEHAERLAYCRKLLAGKHESMT